jgi:hypothetical protein
MVVCNNIFTLNYLITKISIAHIFSSSIHEGNSYAAAYN